MIELVKERYASAARACSHDYDIDSIAAIWLSAWSDLWKMERAEGDPVSKAEIAQYRDAAEERFRLHARPS